MRAGRSIAATQTEGRVSMSGVLVTGGSGFVGLPLLAELALDGDEVHAISRSVPSAEVPGVRWHQLDMADGSAVERLMADIAPERLVHLAWYVEHGRFWSAPENLVWVERSLHLLRAFVRAGGRRIVMLGTCAEYDWSSVEGPLEEARSAVAPSTLYGIAKDSLHRLAAAYARQEQLELAWARLFFMYGPREQPGRLVPSVIRSLLCGETVATTSGEQQRDYVHVDDVAGALAALARSQVVGPVDIASGRATRIRDIVVEIADQIGASELLHIGELPDRPDEPDVLVGCGARLREQVGYRMQIGLPDGIAGTVQWWRERL
jgi:nucleoside-diphosphate-sugar epimerase